MTVALVLATEADAGLRGQLTALGVRRVDAAERAGAGLLTVAAAARAAGERVLICAGQDAVPEPVLARLLAEGGTVAFSRVSVPDRAAGPGARRPAARAGALVVDAPDLGALAAAAESVAAAQPAPDAVGALLGELGRRGVRVRMLAAGPDGDGPVAGLLEPAVRDIASWAAWRGLSPAAMHGFSLGLGLLGAAWFSELAIRAKLAAVSALLGSFLAARAGSLLAVSGRGERTRQAAEWFGAAAGLLTEIAVYAALAVSAGRGAGLAGVFGGRLAGTAFAGWGGTGSAGVWRLAAAAVIMLGVRHLAGLCRERAAPPALPRRRAGHVVGRAVGFRSGERFAVIAVTAVFFGPRLTFAAMVGLGAAAAGYALAGLPSGAGAPGRAGGGLAGYRGDGVLARRLGGLVQGKLVPLLPALVGVFVTCVLAALGLANLPGLLVLTPVAAMLPAALGARHRHDGRMDWLVPPLLATGECVYLAALGFAWHAALPVVFALLAAVVLRHADLGYRARSGRGIPADAFGLGWDGRMLLAGLAAAAGLVPLACAVLSGYLWLLCCWDFLTGWYVFAREATALDRDGPGRRRGPAAAA
ncbi:MAG TPA: DUF5941 domain-containing protein [Streptosporangiaceae bacterium]|jgi:hypothetical protein|nr:DUF5941 domain-containing protein [Streptosporangiaceae bacterium]